MGAHVTEKLRINGIKLSEELVQINLAPGGEISAGWLFRQLAVRRINLPLVALAAHQGGVASACCLAADDLPLAQALLDTIVDGVRIIPAVGALTVFPHRTRFDLLGGVLGAFHRCRLPVHAIASSLSALTLTTDYGGLEAALAAVQAVATLPQNHAPFHPEFKVWQI
jgi:hypothetical protein